MGKGQSGDTLSIDHCVYETRDCTNTWLGPQSAPRCRHSTAHSKHWTWCQAGPEPGLPRLPGPEPEGGCHPVVGASVHRRRHPVIPAEIPDPPDARTDLLHRLHPGQHPGEQRVPGHALHPQVRFSSQKISPRRRTPRGFPRATTAGYSPLPNEELDEELAAEGIGFVVLGRVGKAQHAAHGGRLSLIGGSAERAMDWTCERSLL